MLTSYIYYILYIIYSCSCLIKFNPFTWDDHSTIIWGNLWLTPTNRAVSSCFRPECVVLLPVEIDLKHIGRQWCFFDCHKGSRSEGAGGSLSLILQWMFADLTVLPVILYLIVLDTFCRFYTPWMYKNLASNGLNYDQPQLVNAGFLKHRVKPLPPNGSHGCDLGRTFKSHWFPTWIKRYVSWLCFQNPWFWSTPYNYIYCNMPCAQR